MKDKEKEKLREREKERRRDLDREKDKQSSKKIVPRIECIYVFFIIILSSGFLYLIYLYNLTNCSTRRRVLLNQSFFKRYDDASVF